MFAENLNKEVQNIKEKISDMTPIKSIQRGTVRSTGSTTIEINQVNVDKSLVLLNSLSAFYTGGTSGREVKPGVYLEKLSANSLTVLVENNSNYTKTVSWQVIEFY